MESKEVKKIISNAEQIAALLHCEKLSDLSTKDLHDALSKGVMLQLAPQWQQDYARQRAGRMACYLSAEYLLGRLVYNNLNSLGILADMKKALAKKGVDLAALEDVEDAALGNGGLGRLAACFLDSAATLGKPVIGYGLRYRFGLFRQSIQDHAQQEAPDDWNALTDPWSVRREGESVEVAMKGLTVRAVPYDMPVIGCGGQTIGTLRLWQCESEHPLDFAAFTAQRYAAAVKNQDEAENITRALYPNDSTRAGRLLRLRQQYVLCSATMQDLLRNFKACHGSDFAQFSAYHAIQLNDTHPAMAIPELIRLLTQEGVSFEEALTIARKTFAYTNHTVMPEALEKWDLTLMRSVSPALTDIIRELSRRQEQELQAAGVPCGAGLALIWNKQVQMASLAMYGSFAVNGVAAIHSQLLKDTVLKDWYALRPEMFQNKTNGITPRRWLGLCNPELTALIERRIGAGFLTELDRLAELKPFIDSDPQILADFMDVKREKKRQLAAYMLKKENVILPEGFVLDVQVKRIHEYKRQLMNAFSALDIYYRLKAGELADLPPVAMVIGGKAFASYARAKAIVRFINEISALVNSDPEMEGRFRVIFIQNYDCSYAEKLIPAADISEQISPAGTEASGTSNMKFMLNGAVTLGTMDGANIEIIEKAGAENNFIFGATLSDLDAIRGGYRSRDLYEREPRIRRAVDTLVSGVFPDPDGAFAELHAALLDGASWHAPDHYYVLLDFLPYMDAKLRAIRAAASGPDFARACLHNVAAAGPFSSDRTISQYCEEIWKV